MESTADALIGLGGLQSIEAHRLCRLFHI